MDSYDPTIENTFNKTVKIRNQDFEIFIVGKIVKNYIDIHWTISLTDFTIYCKRLMFNFFLYNSDTAGQDEYSIFPTQYAVDIHG